VKLLLDTPLLLWAAGQPERLSARTKRQLNDPHNELLFSAASLWGKPERVIQSCDRQPSLDPDAAPPRKQACAIQGGSKLPHSISFEYDVTS
jgi:hypothetical protein